MSGYPHIAARLFNTPLMVHPQKLDAIIAGLGPRLGVAAESLPEPGAYEVLPGERRAPGYRVHNGIAVIDVFGALTHRGRMEADSTYLLGYADVQRRLDHALEDRGVRGIVLAIDSPGGEVHGVYQLADRIRRGRERKPIRAMADGAATSAAFLLASATERITATETGALGSVGVVMRHADFSGALEKEGVQITPIFAGEHKVDGNPWEPLPDDVRAKLQADVDSLHDRFVQAVADYRGLDADAVRNTEAQTYLAREALDVGFADDLGTLEDVINTMQSDTNRERGLVSSGANTTGAGTMSQTEDKLYTQAEVDAARAEGAEQAKAEHTEALEAAKQEAVEAERTRVNAILTHSEAEGRTSLAIRAVTTGLSVEQAGELLAASPKSQSGQMASLQAVGNPDVGPAGDDEGETDSPHHLASSWDRAFGRA